MGEKLFAFETAIIPFSKVFLREIVKHGKKLPINFEKESLSVIEGGLKFTNYFIDYDDDTNILQICIWIEKIIKNSILNGGQLF